MTQEEVKKDEVQEEGAGSEQPVEKAEESKPKYTEQELRAIEQGWKPKDEWDGDPEDHRSAREYLDRGELLGKIKAQGVQLREVQGMLQHMSEHNRKVYAAGYEKGLKELKSARVQAIKAEDYDALEEIEDRIDQHKDALAAIKQAPQPRQTSGEQSPVYQEWLRTNKWYLEDQSLRHWANGMAVDYAQRTPGVTEDEIYDYLSKSVRKTFPNRFRQQGTGGGAPNPDGEGRRSSGKTTKSANDAFEQLLESFSEEDARVARSLVKTGVLTKEKYVEDYKSFGG